MESYYSIDTAKSDAASNYLDTDQVKNYLKVEYDITAENTLIEALIKAAESYFEEFTNRALNDHSLFIRLWEISADGIYVNIELPYKGTYSSVVVKTVYEDTETTLTENTDYYITSNRIRLSKTVFTDIENTELLITADVTAVFTDPNIEPALYKLIADMYEQRSNDSIEGLQRISYTTRSLLMPFRDVSTMI